jgi:hypothetical protein
VQPFQKAELSPAFDRWTVGSAVLSLAIAALLGWFSSKGIPVGGFVLALGLGLGILFLGALRSLDRTLRLALQVALGVQIIPAIQFDLRPVLTVALIFVAIAPSILWLITTKWGAFSYKGWIGYSLVAIGFSISLLPPIQFGQVPFVFGTGDLALLAIVITSVFSAILLKNGLFSRTLILSTMAASSTFLVVQVVIVDFFGSGMSLTNHRVGISAFLGPNLLAFCLDMAMPLNMGLALRCERPLLRKVLLSNAFIQLVILLLTGTRGSIPTVVATSLWLLFHFRKHKYFFVVVPPIGGIVLVVLVQKMAGRLMLKSEMEILSTLGRLFLLKTAWTILETNKFLSGIGINRFSEVKFDFGFPLWFNPTKSMSTHNTYLEYWVGWGAFALLGYVFTVARACRNLFMQSGALEVGAAIAILGYSFHGFVDSSVANYPITITFWLLLSVGISAEKTKSSDLK